MRDITAVGSVIRDLQGILGCKNLFEWIEDRATELSRYGGAQSDRVQLTKQLFEERKIVAVQVTEKLKQNATIHMTNSGYTIRCARGLPPERVRFALAHEIGHTYFFKPDGDYVSALQTHNDRTVEALCDYFARSLLVPRDRLELKLYRLGHFGASIPPLHLTPILARDFGVAEQAIARRLVFDFWEDLQAVVCITDRGSSDRPNWRTNWCATAANNVLGIPSGWRIPLDTHGRKIPADMVPNISTGETARVSVDGRWHKSVRPQSRSDSKRWLSRQVLAPAQPAVVGSVLTNEELFESPRRRFFLAL